MRLSFVNYAISNAVFLLLSAIDTKLN